MSETVIDLGYKWTHCFVTNVKEHRDFCPREPQSPTSLYYIFSCTRDILLLPTWAEVNRFLPFRFLYCIPSCINVGLMDIYLGRTLTMKKNLSHKFCNIDMLKKWKNIIPGLKYGYICVHVHTHNEAKGNILGNRKFM